MLGYAAKNAANPAYINWIFMKTLSLQIDDSLYDALVTLLKQLPESKIKILEIPDAPVKLDFEKASEYVLKKNAELYKRLA